MSSEFSCKQSLARQSQTSVTYAHHLHPIGSCDVEITVQFRFEIGRGALEKHPLTALRDRLFGDGRGEIVSGIDTFGLAQSVACRPV